MVRFIFVLLLIFSYSVSAQDTSPEDPHEFYLDFTGHMDTLLGSVATDQKFFRKHTSVLEGVVGSHVNSYIDYEGISQFVTGKYWRWASKKEKAEFIVEFKRELVRSYSRFILKYANETIDWGYSYKSARDHILVTAEVGKDKLGFYFRKRNPDDNMWKLYDIKVSSISITSTYRSQYRRILQAPARASARKSIKGLIRHLKKRNNAQR